MVEISQYDIERFRIAVYLAVQEALGIPPAWMEKIFPEVKRKPIHGGNHESSINEVKETK